MPRREVTGRRPIGKAPPIPKRGKSVAQFCTSWGVSRSTYETWRRLGVGPREIQPVANGRILISEEAELEWATRRAALAAVADHPAE
jgi:hypothetical protein